MIIRTENSTYEIEDQKIRRLCGKGEPSKTFEADGKWHEFSFLYPATPVVGKRLLVGWNPEKGTHLSVVKSVR